MMALVDEVDSGQEETKDDEQENRGNFGNMLNRARTRQAKTNVIRNRRDSDEI